MKTKNTQTPLTRQQIRDEAKRRGCSYIQFGRMFHADGKETRWLVTFHRKNRQHIHGFTCAA